MNPPPFLADLSRGQLELLTPLFEEIRAPADSQIFRRGDQATHLYLIRRGTATVRYKPYDGPTITLTHLHAGDVFGWSAVAGGRRYASEVVSETDLEALRIRGADLRRLCAEHPEAGRSILEKLAEAVSPRWENARDQVQNMLKSKVQLKK
jgi:CRP/FNR family transcriptional regulator, cyclic AMP receptor protein